MYHVKLFSADKKNILEQAVNEWLQQNKEIMIHQSDFSKSNADTVPASEYHFYILYSGPEEQAEELKELAVAATHDQSIEVKEINPEILKPTS